MSTQSTLTCIVILKCLFSFYFRLQKQCKGLWALVRIWASKVQESSPRWTFPQRLQREAWLSLKDGMRNELRIKRSWFIRRDISSFPFIVNLPIFNAVLKNEITKVQWPLKWQLLSNTLIPYVCFTILLQLGIWEWYPQLWLFKWVIPTISFLSLRKRSAFLMPSLVRLRNQ